ncbi:MAG: aminotransferase class V-fold PLP-dependent enzyme [Pseudomonadota bacterium]
MIQTAAADIDPADEAYWATVRDQYEVSDQVINLENGYFGVQARPVFQAFQRYGAMVNQENSYFLRVKYPPLLAGVMRELARFAGVAEEELVITRNLVEAMNILIQGYPFTAGDEVLLNSQDYESVVDTLQMVSLRKGIRLVQLSLPLDASDDDIVSLYERAITPSTRVILLTHMIHRSGQIMPVAKIAAMARRHGVDVMVDAAHSFAQLQYQMPDLNSDFIAVNLHKWLGAPLGVGLLYIRRQRIAEIAPLYADTHCAAGDIQKLAHFGTLPPAPILAIRDAIAFHESIGSRNKEARLRYLKDYWVSRVRPMPQVQMLVPAAPERSCAIAAFRIAGMPSEQVVEHLLSKHRIFTVVRQIDGLSAVRVTPHLYTTTAQLDLLVAAIAGLGR